MEYIKTNDECCTFIAIYNITNFVWKKKKNVHFPFCTQFVQSSKRELKLFFDYTYFFLQKNQVNSENDFICAPDSRFRKNVFHHHIFFFA